MKKLLILCALGLLPLASCSGPQTPAVGSESSTQETTITKTNYEIVKEFMDSFVIENADAIVENIFLPKRFDLEGVITWKSSEPKVVTSEGHVTRSKDRDINVTLTAIAQLGSTKETRIYNVVVKKIDGAYSAQLEEVVANFNLLEDNKIDRDIMVLPRVSDLHAAYIEWQSSDESIIDLDGHVYRKNVEQHVTLTGTFKLGNEKITKDFAITVGTITDDSAPTIDENDPRILNVVEVSNLVDIIAAINEVKPGDAIVLLDGTYRDVVFNIKTSGTEEHPIFITAKNPGKVKLSGESRLDILADHVIIANLSFVDGYPSKDTGVVNLYGNHIRFTNNLIKNYELVGNDYKWLSLTGRFHEIDRNIFDGKSTGGSLLTIWRNDMSSQNHHIHHNQFLNYQDAGGANGYETIRVGTSTYSQSDSNVLIEDNLFENISGEIEIISIKASRTIVRNNTFKTCKGLVTARHGKNDLIEGNVFFCDKITDTGGIRMYDGGHIVRNNYIQDVLTSSNTRAGIVIHSGVNEVGETTVMNLQWTPFNVLVKDNTIVNSRNSILIGGKYNVPCKDVTFDNNLVVSPDYGAIRFDKNPTNATWTNNHFYAPMFLEANSVFKDVATPNWFSTDIPSLTKDENGLDTYMNQGASKLKVQTKNTTGTNF